MPGRSRAEVEAVKGDHERCAGLGSCEQEPPGIGAEVACRMSCRPIGMDGTGSIESIGRSFPMWTVLSSMPERTISACNGSSASGRKREYTTTSWPRANKPNISVATNVSVTVGKHRTRNATLSDGELSGCMRAIGGQPGERTYEPVASMGRARPAATLTAEAHPRAVVLEQPPTASENASRPSSPVPSHRPTYAPKRDVTPSGSWQLTTGVAVCSASRKLMESAS